jgi:hypothetical protein
MASLTPDLHKQVSKKLLNEPTDAVWQMIEGLVETNGSLNRIDGFNVVVRSDADVVKNDQVAVISGTRPLPTARACARRCVRAHDSLPRRSINVPAPHARSLFACAQAAGVVMSRPTAAGWGRGC